MTSAEDLAARVVELCGQVCVTGHERPIADALAAAHPGAPGARVGNSLVVGAPGDAPLVLLVGHIDVVPATDLDARPQLTERDEHGPVVVGRGASDMKGGIAVAEALYLDPSVRDHAAYEVALVLYAGEEGPVETNELDRVLAEVPWLHDADLAIVLEPTDLEIHAGCLGGLHAELVFRGRQSHSARPWHGRNALTAAGEILTELAALQPVDVAVDGVAFRDVLTATQAWTDNARNVIPGRFVVNVNYRFAPNRTLEDAEAELLEWVDGRVDVDVVDRAPPAPPNLDAPLVSAFVEHAGTRVAAKQAWTDVARLAQAGIPALNYGPGLTAQAHQAGEFVPLANLQTVFDTIRSFLLRPR